MWEGHSASGTSDKGTSNKGTSRKKGQQQEERATTVNSTDNNYKGSSEQDYYPPQCSLHIKVERLLWSKKKGPCLSFSRWDFRNSCTCCTCRPTPFCLLETSEDSLEDGLQTKPGATGRPRTDIVTGLLFPILAVCLMSTKCPTIWAWLSCQSSHQIMSKAPS